MLVCDQGRPWFSCFVCAFVFPRRWSWWVSVFGCGFGCWNLLCALLGQLLAFIACRSSLRRMYGKKIKGLTALLAVILLVFTKVGFCHMVVCGSFLRHVEIGHVPVV